jgi:DNA-binding CsgD family transcriptional regulator
VRKSRCHRDLLPAIHAAARDGVFLDPEAVATLLQVDRKQVAERRGAGVELNVKEQPVCALTASGYGPRAIGRRLGLSPHAVDEICRTLMTKLGLRDRTTLIEFAYGAGLLPPPWTEGADPGGSITFEPIKDTMDPPERRTTTVRRLSAAVEGDVLVIRSIPFGLIRQECMRLGIQNGARVLLREDTPAHLYLERSDGGTAVLRREWVPCPQLRWPRTCRPLASAGPAPPARRRRRVSSVPEPGRGASGRRCGGAARDHGRDIALWITREPRPADRRSSARMAGDHRAERLGSR